MLLRERIPLNNSRSRSGLMENPVSAEVLRAAGLGIIGASGLWLALSTLHVSPWFPATIFAVGLAVCARGFTIWPAKRHLPTPQAAFRAMPAHLAALDIEGNVILVNDAWRQFAVSNGFRGDGQGEGVNYIALCESATGDCAEEARAVATGIRNVLDGKQDTFSIEYPCHSPTEERWFRCLVSRFPGDEHGALVTHLDITEQVRMRAQVKELSTGALEQKKAADKLQSLSLQEIADLKAALDEHAIVAICDRDGRILSVNAKYCEISRFSQGQLIGSSVDLDQIPERSKALRNGVIWKGEVQHQTRGGESYWLAETIVPFHAEDGGIGQYIIIGTDITARKRAEASLLERGEALSRSNAALAEFAYLASHDLQEPLRGVNGCVQLLAKRYGDQIDAEGREWIRHAVLNTERMQSLIAGLLDLSRVERNPGIPTVPVDTQLLVAGTVDALKQSIQESGAQVEVHGPLPLLQGDARQIGQVFQNLLLNSIKFHSNEPPRVIISANPTVAAGFAEFVVRDNGIGIDPKHAERIFGIFQKLHAPGKFPGSGIGLAIAKRIVERHGGRIWVQPLPQGEVGAEFRFTLPLQNATSGNPQAKGATASQ